MFNGRPQLNPKFYLSIKVKLILFLSVLLLLVCSSLSFVFAFYTIEVFNDDLQKRGLSEASNLAIESKFGTLTEDTEILMSLLNNKFLNPDILYIEIMDKQGGMLASSYRYPSSQSRKAKKSFSISTFSNQSSSIVSKSFYINDTLTNINYYKIIQPIYSTPLSQNNDIELEIDALSEQKLVSKTDTKFPIKNIIGEVHIGFSLSRLEAKTRNVLEFISIISLAILFIAILTGYILAKRVLTPLLTMSTIATQIANNNLQNVTFSQHSMTLNNPKNTLQTTLAATPSDEIGMLIIAFIKMSSRLKDYGYNLEQQVKKRTEELSQSLKKSRQLKSVAEHSNEQLLITNSQLQLFQRCIEKTSDFILIIDQKGLNHTSNESFQKQNGYSSQQIKALSFDTFFAPSEIETFHTRIWPTVVKQGEWKGKTKFITKSGDIYLTDLSITSVRDDQNQTTAYICISRDITLEEGQKQKLIELASSDPLTGLYNRRRFLEKLEKEIIRSKRLNSELALLWLDLDHFKEINDSLGHPAGDELLKNLTTNLKALTRNTDIIARLGGDEFAILLCDSSRESAKTSAERIIKGTRSNVMSIASQPIRIMISMGIAMFPSDADSSNSLFSCADIALYKSKHAGRNQYNFFHTDDMKHGQYSHHDAWTQRIIDSIEENRLFFYRQAIINISDNNDIHYELLLRMKDEQGNIIMPDAFIPLAERSSLICEIDRWVIANAVNQYSGSDIEKKRCKVAINLSAKALSDDSFPDFIESVMSAAAVDPKMFIIEITENSAIADFNKATQFISRLKNIGCKFALDDFGVGFASFLHLKNLDVDYLKIDGGFIKDINLSTKDKDIVAAMIKVAQSLNIKTIGEWVETAETMTILNHLGIDFVQGNYLGKPEPFSTKNKPTYY